MERPLEKNSFMDDARIRALLAQPTSIPPRELTYGDRDHFDLLEVEDTYEPIVMTLFDGCEAMEQHLISPRYSRKSTVTLPEISFDSVRSYTLSRTQDKVHTEKQYSFQRVGKPKSGFLLIRKSDGHILLRHPEQGETPFTDNEEYAKLITQAGSFLQEYARGCGITPEMLAKPLPAPPAIKVPKPEKPPKLPRRGHPVAAQVARAAIVTSTLLGIPAYTVRGSIQTGSEWISTQLKQQREDIAGEQVYATQQNAKLKVMETSLGKLCATALAPYSPNNSLGSVELSAAAAQLVEDDRCNLPGMNTQLVVQNYRSTINNINNAYNDENTIYNNIQTKQQDEQMEYTVLVIAGLVVGAIGDGIAYVILDEINSSLKQRRKSLNTRLAESK
jgi:hypothetical protein